MPGTTTSHYPTCPSPKPVSPESLGLVWHSSMVQFPEEIGGDALLGKGRVEIGVVAEVGAAGAAGKFPSWPPSPATDFLHLLLAASEVPLNLSFREENWNTNNTQGHPPSPAALRQPLTDPPLGSLISHHPTRLLSSLQMSWKLGSPPFQAPRLSCPQLSS